ncbi:hypothetical protein BDB01DRAFT_855966 [Pilobolus umbonatus]|nr:hypothetical protein BDB01DRAFT_855966 [Pilobolus umbonatus]
MNQSASTYSIHTYQPVSTVIEVPFTEYEKVIEGSIAKYGVKWMYNRKVTAKNSNDEEAASATSIPPIKRSANKKSNCPARLKVTCFKNNPNMVTLENVNEHNHAIGGSDDIKHLPLSREAREYIKGQFREGYRKRDTRLSIQKNNDAFMQSLSIGDSLESSTVLHRDQFVHADEIYNIYKEFKSLLTSVLTTKENL